jgi:uncharacterized membrane protein
MPGIKKLNDSEFIRAFQVMDGIIQKNQPLFMLVWVGSVLVLVATAALGIGNLDGIGHVLIIASALVYIIGVQLPTGIINIPLNNMLQSLDVNDMDEAAHKKVRESFEPRWNKWNNIRTVLSCLVSVLLIILVSRI